MAITQGAAIFEATGKSVFQTVLEQVPEADRASVAAKAILIFNTSPGYRPSDAAREAVRRYEGGR